MEVKKDERGPPSSDSIWEIATGVERGITLSCNMASYWGGGWCGGE